MKEEKKRVPKKNEKAFRNQALLQKSHQRDEHQDSSLCKGTLDHS